MLFNRIPQRGIPELDTLRFLSVSLVIAHHLFFKSNPLFDWLSVHGYVGVDIFFTLSGFIITKGIIRESEKTGTLNLKNFWIRRVLRLWPSWLLSLFLSSIGIYLIGRNNPEIMNTLVNKWWHYFLHFGNYSYAFFGKLHTLYGHYWSLAVEEHFYIIWPVLFIVILKRKSLKVPIFFSLLILPYLFRVLHKMQGYENVVNTFSTHTRIDAILYGCILALFWNHIPKVKALWHDIVLWIVALSLMHLGLSLKFYEGSFWISQSAHSWRSLSTVLIIVLLINGYENGVRVLFRNKILSALGVLSYAAYLHHFLFNTFLFKANEILDLSLGQPMLFFLALTGIYFPAYLNFNFIELPFEKLKARFK